LNHREERPSTRLSGLSPAVWQLVRESYMSSLPETAEQGLATTPGYGRGSAPPAVLRELMAGS